MLHQINTVMQKINIALVGDYNDNVTAHLAIPRALRITAKNGAVDIDAQWIATEDLDENTRLELRQYHGIWCVPASPYKNKAGAIAAIRYARENGVPFLGTCGGYQHAILEFARNVLGQDQADNLEDNPQTSMPLIAPMSCSLLESEGDIELLENSKISSLYGTARITEKYNCSYGFNREYLPLFENCEMRISAYDADGDPRAIEIPNHPFFVGVAFQPERSAFANISHPLINAFVDATIEFST